MDAHHCYRWHSVEGYDDLDSYRCQSQIINRHDMVVFHFYWKWCPQIKTSMIKLLILWPSNIWATITTKIIDVHKRWTDFIVDTSDVKDRGNADNHLTDVHHSSSGHSPIETQISEIYLRQSCLGYQLMDVNLSYLGSPLSIVCTISIAIWKFTKQD